MSNNSTNKVTVQFEADIKTFQSKIGEAGRSVANFSVSVEQSMAKVSKSMNVLKAVVGVVTAKMVMDATKDASQYEALMDNLSSRMGASANDFVKWSETTGRALGYSKLESAKFANTLSVNFSQIATSQADLTNRTTTMMEAAAIIRSKTGRTMEDVSERIRSAMNQEADGADELGLNVRTSAIVQSEAYKKMANGQAWSELTNNMQKAILYQYVLDSTVQNFGTTMQENASLRMAQFSASLGDLKVALGQAFLPIVTAVLPYLNAFIQAITTADRKSVV